MKKAQSAIEFVIIIGAVLFFVVAFLMGIQTSTSDKLSDNKALVLYEVAATVQDEINLAAESTNGYYREFDLINNILGTPYEINITGSFVYARTTDGYHATSLPIANVTGDVIIGTNTIQKVNGEIILN